MINSSDRGVINGKSGKATALPIFSGTLTLSQSERGQIMAKGPFIYYVITFLGFLDPPPALRKHVFSTENNQKLAFSDPPPPLQVI